MSRVVIFCARSIWISPVFPPLEDGSTSDGDSCTGFKRDLLRYLETYKTSQVNAWVKVVQQHNLSAARSVVHFQFTKKRESLPGNVLFSLVDSRCALCNILPDSNENYCNLCFRVVPFSGFT